MADPTDDEKLKEAAEHRGLKLVRSRRRKPGIGDYGKFGLTDAAGKPLLGIGEDGLTATAQEISGYLRAGATSTWKISAETAAASPPRENRAPRSVAEEAGPSAIRPRARRAKTAVPRQKESSQARAGVEGAADDEVKLRSRPATAKACSEPSKAKRRRPVQNPSTDQVARAEAGPAEQKPRPDIAPAPELMVRPAKPVDAAAIARLLDQLSDGGPDEAAVARNLDLARKMRGGMAVALLGELVGGCAWTIVPTIQHGPIGRLTLILIDEGHRRSGIGTALVDAAIAALRKAGCARIEAMSDIEIQNAHNFFRTLKFKQTSYRFAKEIGDG